MSILTGHLDMDAFFASVEERDSPQFKGLPIVVGANPKFKRGVVSTANYKAREYGVHSAMPIYKAWQISLKAKDRFIFLEPDFEKYIKASKEVYAILKKYSSKVEPASIDEFYFSAQGGPASGWDDAVEICEKIKKEIKEKLNLSCSIGIGKNKLISKIAAGFKKPDGLTVVKDGYEFLTHMSVKEIPGIGPKTNKILSDLGIKTIEELRNVPESELISLFGKFGKDIYMRARGEDDSEIVEEREVKSIGKQDTLLKDTLDASVIIPRFKELCKEVYDNFKESGFKGFKTIAVTVRFEGFETKTSSKTFDKDIKKEFFVQALNLLLLYLDKRKNPEMKLIRLIGVRVENLIK